MSQSYAARRAHRPSVMLAEDDEINRDIVRCFLDDLDDLDMTEAPDGREALSLCLTRRFDLLILDLRLPIIGGDRIARHLRSSVNQNATTPIILSSAMSLDELGPLLKYCPYDRLLPKPFSRDGLLFAVMAELGIAAPQSPDSQPDIEN